jgi:hypothetical protein
VDEHSFSRNPYAQELCLHRSVGLERFASFSPTSLAFAYISKMNQPQPYIDMHAAPHMSSAQPYASQPATSGGVPHYPQYQQQQILQPGPGHYAPAPTSYGTYGYPNGVTSPQSASQPSSTPVGSQVPSHGLTLPGKDIWLLQIINANLWGFPSHDHRPTGTAQLHVLSRRTWTRLSCAAPVRYHRPSRSTRYETASYGNVMGG